MNFVEKIVGDIIWSELLDFEITLRPFFLHESCGVGSPLARQ